MTSQAVDPAIPYAQVVHGTLMTVAWLILIPIGIYIAAFHKNLGHLWYRLHLGIQSIAIGN